MKKHIQTNAVLFLLLGVILIPVISQAQSFDPTAYCDTFGLSCSSVTDVLVGLVRFLLGILTLLGVLGFIISGIIYITAGGAGKADLARHWLTYSILGMFVGLSAYIIIGTIANILQGNTNF